MDANEAQGWERLATNLRVERALLELLEHLEEFPVVVFKGPLLTRELFGDLRRRASTDNDLWIHDGRAHAGLERLLDLGYMPEPGLDPHRALDRAGQVALWPNGDFTEVSCDLHASPFSAGMFSVDEALMLRHVVTKAMHGHEVRTFDRYLTLTHLIAHYLQHRLERRYLWEIGLAWDEWTLDEAELRQLSVHTCGEVALEFAINAASAADYSSRSPLPFGTGRARLLSSLSRSGTRIGGESTARMLSLLVANPGRIPRQVWKGTFLESDELLNRYGSGSRWIRTCRRIKDLVQRG